MPGEATPGLTPGTTPAPTGHDAAMAAKMDANDAAALAAAGVQPQPANQPPQRPDNVPEKFWDAKTGQVNTEALLKSYSELEKGKTTPPADDAAKAAAAAADAAAKAANPDAEAAKAAVGGETFDKATAEFTEKGELSAETYAALEAKGIGKALVDSYIAGQVALQSSAEARSYALVGGQEKYGTMLQWAGQNMTATEIDAFDKAVLGTNEASRTQAVMGLKARYEAAYGSDQSGMVNGQVTDTVRGYASEAEMTKDMRDPRYKADPAYRRQVENKLAVTTAF